MADGLAVIVLSKDRPDLFRACDASLYANPAPYLVQKLLVQNGTDAETLAEAKSRGWSVIDSRGENWSFSAGNNVAVRSAGEAVSHVLLLNNDAELLPGSLDALWSARARADVVGSFILNPDGSVNHAGVYFGHNLGPMHLGKGADVSGFPPGRDLYHLPAVTFACVLLSVSGYHAVGGLDERYWYAYEDIDYCLRAREAGQSVMVARDAVVVHAESSTRNGDWAGRRGEPVWDATWVNSGRLLRAVYGRKEQP